MLLLEKREEAARHLRLAALRTERSPRRAPAEEVEVRESARAMGMTGGEILRRVELPLAAPVILAGIRVSVVINVGTATIASTVGAKTLGLPIIVGLNGSNIAYVIQGAVLVALLGVVLDMAFERLVDVSRRWRAD